MGTFSKSVTKAETHTEAGLLILGFHLMFFFYESQLYLEALLPVRPEFLLINHTEFK